MKFVSKEDQNFDLTAAILNSTQQPCCVFVTSFRLRDFVQMASDKRLNFHSGLWLLLSHIILSRTCSKCRNDSIEDSEVDNHLGKKYMLLTLWRMQSQLQVFLLPVNFESDGMTLEKHGQAAKTLSKWGPPKSLLSRQISSEEPALWEAETSVSVKAECLLSIGEDI